MKYRTRVLEVEAVQWQNQPREEWPDRFLIAHDLGTIQTNGLALSVYFDTGVARVNRGDWVVFFPDRDADRLITVVSAERFALDFEPALDSVA